MPDRPPARSARSGHGSHLLVEYPVSGGLLCREGDVPPGQPRLDHLQPNVPAVQQEGPDRPQVAVPFLDFYGDILTAHHGGHSLLGLGAERLGVFWGVNPTEPDRDCPFGVIQDLHRVPVADVYNPAAQRLGG